MVRNNALVRVIQVTAPPPNSPPGTPNVPQDITNWKLYFTVKWNLADQDTQAICQLSSATTGITKTIPTGGYAQITMPPGVTASVPDAPVDVYYDVLAIDTFGNPYTVEQGTITVGPSVTRAMA